MSFVGIEKGGKSATDMNNNHYSRGRNFGGPFVPSSSYFQGHNNKFNAGIYGFPFGPGMQPMHGPYPNSNKTFCTTAANMKSASAPANGYHRNNGQQQQQQQQQKLNFHNYYSPTPQPQAKCQSQYQTGNAGIPSNNNGFLNGLKNIVNHLIAPKCDFYSDHSRRYNPKHRNNYKYDQQQIPVQTAYPDEVFGSVVFNIGAYCPTSMQGAKVHVAPQFHQKPPATPAPQTTSQPKSPPPPPPQQQSKPTPMPSKQNCIKVSYKPASPEIIAIFTSEDFPELPKPKKPTFCATFPKPKCPAEKSSKSPSPCPNPQTTVKKPPVVSSSKPPVTKSIQTPKVRQISECSSEDSFIVFANDSPVCSVQNQTASTPPTIKFHSGLLPFRQRQRQMSECSDDSFVICFQDESGNSNPEIIDFSDFSDESDSDDEDEDDVDGGVCTKNVPDDDDDDDFDVDDVRDHKEGNRLCNYGAAYRETSQPDSGFDEKKEKKVRFKLKPDVHVMHSWDFAYRAARKGPWEEIARDRCRFKQRIEKLGEIIGPILSDTHRMKIFNTRFCDNVTNDCNNSLDQVCKSSKDDVS